MSTSGKVMLESNDHEMFKVDEAVASVSITIKNMLEDTPDNDVYRLPNVPGKTLAKVIEYCEKHVHSETPAVEEELKNFDADFVKVGQKTLFDLIMAANYLNIQGLLDLTCQAVADMIKNKTVEEAREIFGVKSDFTEAEEEALKNEYEWAFK